MVLWLALFLGSLHKKTGSNINPTLQSLSSSFDVIIVAIVVVIWFSTSYELEIVIWDYLSTLAKPKEKLITQRKNWNKRLGWTRTRNTMDASCQIWRLFESAKFGASGDMRSVQSQLWPPNGLQIRGEAKIFPGLGKCQKAAYVGFQPDI
jgi:hypothetical protein